MADSSKWESMRENIIGFGQNSNRKSYFPELQNKIQELEATEKELLEHKNNLEKLVKERTQELEQKNEELNKALNDLKETQTKLIHSEKMASLGILTAGVAHEINNPLNYIMGSYYGLEEYFLENGSKDSERTKFLLESINIGINKITNIVKGLNQFSRRNESKDEVCDINGILENCLIMLHNKIKDRIELVKECSPESPVIQGNVGKLHQVFINLLTNACQAIPSKGTITVKTTQIENHVKVEISDTGTGISPDIISKIMDPFFTTKDPGEGTGLGLSITHKIIEEHKGEIHFNSVINTGTLVTVILPKV